jgi:FG-GAP-like repeat/FG-GAP repeat
MPPRNRSFAVVLFVVVMAEGFVSAQSPFTFAKDYVVGSNPVAIAAGDFNGDGRQDMVVADKGEDRVSVLLAKADGQFSRPHKYRVGSSPAAVAVADVNGDNKLDIVVTGGRFEKGSVGILLGNGDGTFQPEILYDLPAQGFSLAVGDFNGDGKPDLAVGYWHQSSSGLAILLNNGNGTFGLPKTYAFRKRPASIEVGDFNSDGHLDLMCAGEDGSVYVVLGNGNGSFQQPVQINLNFSVRSFAVGDFNGDGKLDFVATWTYDYQYGAVEVVLGNGDGTFQPGVTYPSGGIGSTSVVVADLNGDGKLDFAVANTGDDLGIFFGRGDGTFRPQVAYRTGSEANREPGALAVVGFATSKAVDLAVCAGTTVVSVLVGNGKGEFQAARDYAIVPPYNYPEAFAFGDFNSDGKTDMAIPDDQGIAIFMNEGRGTFRTAKHFGLSGSGTALGDFNNDGKLDLVSGATEIGVMLGKGDGTFDHLRTYPVNGRTASFAVGDFDGDGNLDIAAAENYSGHVYVLLGKGDGTFHLPISYITQLRPSVVLVGDLNGDGKLDLYVTGTGPGEVLLGNGDGTFKPPMFSGDPGGVTAVLADFNGDGKLDVALAGFDPTLISVALGKGDGTFLPAQSYAALGGECCVVAADFNGDGKLDIAVGDAGAVSMLYGNGDGTFQNAVNFDACQVWSLGTSDLNGDGFPDLVIMDPHGGFNTSTVAVALNKRGKKSAGVNHREPFQFAQPLAPKSLALGK